MATGSSAEHRRRLVHYLRRRGFLRDQRVAEAFLAVPREIFLPQVLADDGLAAVYRDDAIVTHRHPTSQAPLSSSSQPAIMAIMLDMLGAAPGERVAEIGAGTGYNAALLAQLVGDHGFVVTIDIGFSIASHAAEALGELGSTARVVVADGALGLPGADADGKRFDRIEVTASTVAVPRCWHDQLAPGGRLVVPMRLSEEYDRAHAVTAFEKVADGFDSLEITPGGFMPLRRPDGLPFAPTAPRGAARRSKARPFESASLRDLNRDDMSGLTIVVRYSSQPPDTRWTFPRGDHWIGVDHVTTYRGPTWI